MRILSFGIIFSLFFLACEKEDIAPFYDTNQAVQIMIFEPIWNGNTDTTFLTRNALGKIIERTTERQFFQYIYNDDQRLITEIAFPRKTPLDTAFVKEFSYDSKGRLTKILFLNHRDKSPYVIPISEEVIEYSGKNKVIAVERHFKHEIEYKTEAKFKDGNLIHLKSFDEKGKIQYENITSYTNIASPAIYHHLWTNFHFASKNMPKTQEFVDHTGLIDFACINETFEYTLNENGNPESVTSGCGTTKFVYEQ